MDGQEYTLEELAEMLKIHPRTIRSYIQQGLLRGPGSLGRNARYSDYHAERLRVIKTLKDDYGIKLSEIRRLVTMADPDEEIRVVPVDPGILASTSDPTAAQTALEFVRARQALADEAARSEGTRAQDRGRGQRREADAEAGGKRGGRQRRKGSRRVKGSRGNIADGQEEYMLAQAPATLPRRMSPSLERLLEELRRLVPSGRSQRKTRGREWIRLRVTPDIEIHVRGGMRPEQLAGFERLADYLRDILLGGDSHGR